LAQTCVQRGYPRLDWLVLDWNPAVDFYKSIGVIRTSRTAREKASRSTTTAAIKTVPHTSLAGVDACPKKLNAKNPNISWVNTTGVKDQRRRRRSP